jgi:hypothetical protein
MMFASLGVSTRHCMPPDPPVAVLTAPPESEQLTDYDRAHLATYLRLLDADAMRVDWKVTARTVLALDIEKDGDAARRVYDAHLARARWMTVTGYRLLLS